MRPGGRDREESHWPTPVIRLPSECFLVTPGRPAAEPTASWPRCDRHSRQRWTAWRGEGVCYTTDS
jgi:hypothetical protein